VVSGRHLPLVVTGVGKRYGSLVALAGAQLELHEGDLLALLGPNGAGKSTFVDIVAGLIPPESGRIWIDGIDATSEGTRARARLGLAHQDLGLYPTVSGWDNLRLFGELAGLRRSALRKKMLHLAEALGLESVLDRPARDLSGGQARRLHIGMSLMNEPRLLLLDEATSGLDVVARTQVLGLLRELANQGTSVLYCTHHISEVERLGGAVAIINSGRIIGRGRVEGLLERHGVGTIELTFDGNPPELAEREATISGTRMKVATSAPLAREAARLIVELGDHSQRLKRLELSYPSLENVYLMTIEQSGAAQEEYRR
jgi:ABC-2 type transport system ATP-binding protein